MKRLVSVNACDLLPAAASATKIHSFPIHHALEASEPKLAWLEGTAYVSERRAHHRTHRDHSSRELWISARQIKQTFIPPPPFVKLKFGKTTCAEHRDRVAPAHPVSVPLSLKDSPRCSPGSWRGRGWSRWPELRGVGGREASHLTDHLSWKWFCEGHPCFRFWVVYMLNSRQN